MIRHPCEPKDQVLYLTLGCILLVALLLKYRTLQPFKFLEAKGRLGLDLSRFKHSHSNPGEFTGLQIIKTSPLVKLESSSVRNTGRERVHVRNSYVLAGARTHTTISFLRIKLGFLVRLPLTDKNKSKFRLKVCLDDSKNSNDRKSVLHNNLTDPT